MNTMFRYAFATMLAMTAVPAAAQDMSQDTVVVQKAAADGHALAALSPRVAVGPATKAWMELQRSGAQASTAERSLPGEIADRSYQRYVKSFEQPIPETFEREQFGQHGGSR